MTRRRAMPAEEWVPVQKDATTTAALASGGKAPNATADSKIDEPADPVLRPVIESKPEEVTLPRTKCEGEVHVEKCGCAGAPIPPKEEDKTQKAEVSMQTDAPPDKKVEPKDERQGVMLAFWVPPGVAKSIALDGGESSDEMHLTLGYFGRLGRDITPEQVDSLAKCAADVAKAGSTMKGVISGVGRFASSETSDGKDVVYASVDVPGLSKFRHKLVDEIAKCSGLVKSEIHDYTPHVTLKYVGADEDLPVSKIARQEVEFTHLVLAVGKERRSMVLGEVEQVAKSKWMSIVKADDDDKRLVTGIVLQPEMVDAQGDIYSEDVIRDAAHAFLAKYNLTTAMGLQHSVKAGSPVAMFPKGIRLVESYVTPVELVLNGKVVKKGSWIMTTYIEDDEVWKKIKDGAIRGYSIGGLAKIQRLSSEPYAA